MGKRLPESPVSEVLWSLEGNKSSPNNHVITGVISAVLGENAALAQAGRGASVGVATYDRI